MIFNIGRCRELPEEATRGAVRFPREILELVLDGLALRMRRDAGEISNHGLAVARGRLQWRLIDLSDWRVSNYATWKLGCHLTFHSEQIFSFMQQPGIEATNWPAEQAIRPAVVNRKVFGGYRDENGATAQGRIASVAAMCLTGRGIIHLPEEGALRSENNRDQLACRLLALPAPRSPVAGR